MGFPITAMDDGYAIRGHYKFSKVLAFHGECRSIKKPFKTAIQKEYKGINATDSISIAINFVSVEVSKKKTQNKTNIKHYLYTR